MIIFIDESGGFKIPQTGRPKVCCVGGLAIPSKALPRLSADFLALRSSWDSSGAEVKGSDLSEEMTVSFLSMLAKYDVIFDLYAIDMAEHSPSDIADFKDRQVIGLTKNLTPEHSESMHTELNRLSGRLADVHDSLVIQETLTNLLRMSILQKTTLYYSINNPAELGNIAWRVDAKDVKLTPAERLWIKLMVPWIGSEGRCLLQVEEGDYTHFDRYKSEITTPPYHLRMKNIESEPPYFDVRAIYSQSLEYCDSKNEIGLQLVDIACSTFYKAINGTFQEFGWGDLGRSMVTWRQRNVFTLCRLHQRDEPETKQKASQLHQYHVLQVLQEKGRQIRK